MFRPIKKIKLRIKEIITTNFFRILLAYLIPSDLAKLQQSAEYLEWVNFQLVELTNDFVDKQNLLNSSFIKKINKIFKTTRFEQLLKRWIVEYFLSLFDRLYELNTYGNDRKNKLVLEDNPINRFAVEAYCLRFKVKPDNIRWIPVLNHSRRIISMLFQILYIICHFLNSGLKISSKKKEFKVMREALWGLYGQGGYFFHDDFFVDGKKIHKEDVLFFARPVIVQDPTGRGKAYYDAQKSGYANFYLPSLKIGLKELVLRVIPKYIFQSSAVLFSEIGSFNFSLFQNIFYFFLMYALPYEKVFSNFRVSSELGHNCFAANHIPEAIICQNYGTKYYLMHWSDQSLSINRFNLSFLGCDYFLMWGEAHVRGVEGDRSILKFTWHLFKRFIKWTSLNRDRVLADMKIKSKGRIVTFFDESFGGACKMTEDHYLGFWETILKLAQEDEQNTIVVKPKDLSRYINLSESLKNRFLEIKSSLEKLNNVFIIDDRKWSFIEAVGISDIVITQGMTSSATIAIICGIEGLYLDQAEYNHPFSKMFKDKIVFDSPEKLLLAVHKINAGKDSVFNYIPEELIRKYDAFADDRGIDILRDIFSGNHFDKNDKKLEYENCRNY